MKITKISASVFFLAGLLLSNSNAQSGKRKNPVTSTKPTASSSSEVLSAPDNKPQVPTNVKSHVATLSPAPARITDFAPEIGTVSVNDDSFSDKRKIQLSKTVIAPDAAFALEGEFAKSRTFNPIEIETTPVMFALALLNRPTRTVTGEMNFLVDGKRIEGGEIRSNITMSVYSGDEFDSKGIDSPFVYVSFRNLEKIARGKKVQVKIADQVYDLSNDILKALKDFTIHAR